MSASFKVDVSEFRKRMREAGKKVKASAFKGVLSGALKRTLQTCIKTTPARKRKLIIDAQTRWFNNQRQRYNTGNVALVTHDDGIEWFKFRGKWYSLEWHLPDDVYTEYLYAKQKQQQFSGKSLEQFLEEKLRARFLFRQQWYLIGLSAGVKPTTSAETRSARVRNNDRPKPPKAYAVWRGGEEILSVTLHSALLTQLSQGGNAPLSTSKYRPFNGNTIFQNAFKLNEEEFQRQIKIRLTKALKK